MIALIIIAFLSFVLVVYYGFKALKLRNGNLYDPDVKRQFSKNLTGFLVCFAIMLISLLIYTETYLKI